MGKTWKHLWTKGDEQYAVRKYKSLSERIQTGFISERRLAGVTPMLPMETKAELQVA